MGDFKIFLFQSSADYDTGFSVSAQCFRKDDPVTPYTSCTWMLVTSIQLCIFTFNSYKKFSSPRGIKYKSSQIEHEEGRIRFVKSQSNAVKHTLFRLYPFHYWRHLLQTHCTMGITLNSADTGTWNCILTSRYVRALLYDTSDLDIDLQG